MEESGWCLSGHETSEDKSFRGRDAVVGEGWETSFEKFSDKAQLPPTSGPEGSTLAAGSLKPVSPDTPG